MRKQGRGTIVNMGSLAGKVGEDNRTAECAANGLEGLTAAPQVELQPQGIRVHLISPGATDTSFWSENAPGLTSAQLKRFIPPETVAGAVMWVLGAPEAVHVPDAPSTTSATPSRARARPSRRSRRLGPKQASHRGPGFGSIG